jgi:hypothetical protein
MGKLLDFVEKRKELIEERRQGFERLMFKNLLGAYAVLEENNEISPLNLVDISYSGCGLEIPFSKTAKERFERGNQIKIRMYFTKNSFILSIAEVMYATEIIDLNGKKVLRLGCQFDKSITSYAALNSFIDFLYKFAKFATHDDGATKAFFI